MLIKAKGYTEGNLHSFGAFIGAIISIIAIFFIAPMFEKNLFSHFLLQCNFTLLILSTIYVIDRKRLSIIAGVVFLLPFIFFDFLSIKNGSIPQLAIAYLFSSAFTSFAITVLMQRILHAKLVNFTLIFGALMVYLLAGILWGNFYFVLNMLLPGSFDGSGVLNFTNMTFLNCYEQQFNFLYYSFATLATLGMGDITPLNHLAKSLTAMEAMFGQLFVAVIIAKLVSVWWQVPEKQHNH